MNGKASQRLISWSMRMVFALLQLHHTVDKDLHFLPHFLKCRHFFALIDDDPMQLHLFLQQIGIKPMLFQSVSFPHQPLNPIALGGLSEISSGHTEGYLSGIMGILN